MIDILKHPDDIKVYCEKKDETDAFVVNAYYSLLNDDIYINAVTYSVDNSNQTDKRYNCIDKILNTVKYDL